MQVAKTTSYCGLKIYSPNGRYKNHQQNYTCNFDTKNFMYRSDTKKEIPYNNAYYLPYRSIIFRGKPVKLYDCPISNWMGAVTQWNLLAKQQFSDIHDDKTNPEYKDIRLANYSFLDIPKSEYDKKKFIEYFKNVTDFPNFKKISENIENEFKRAIIKSEYINNTNHSNNYSDVICAGYNSTCSVGRQKAFPGSDLDGAYIIIRGNPLSKNQDKDIVSNFKKELWFHTDARLLSYNHPDAFPEVYTINQIKDLFSEIKKYENVNPINDNIIKKQANCKKSYNEDYIAANPYFMEFIKNFNSSEFYSKEDIKNFGFFVESFMFGKLLYDKNNDYNELKDKYFDCQFSKNTNLSQMVALKKKEPKAKLKLRDEIERSINEYSTDELYELIKTIIMASSGDNKPSKYYNNGNNYIAPLINAILEDK